ncbi:MAG: FtsK/SpoIIIE domain-containing protein [Phycisphaerae bacterium]|nr:FtsK/SpoIIIE domain-containing protein [Phycisphaerae bacterium]
MSQEDKEHAPDGSSGGPDYLDLQRAALRQWIDLSVEAVQAAQSPFEHKYKSASRKAQQRYDQARSKLDRYLQARLETARRHYEEQIGQIDSLHASDLHTLEDNTASLRSRIAHELTKAEQRSQGKLDHELWLSESVAQATREQVTRDLKEFRESFPGQEAVVTTLREQADWLLYQYGQMRLAETEDPPGQLPGSGHPQAAFQQQVELAQEQIAALAELSWPGLLSGAKLYLLAMLVCAIAVGLAALPQLLDWSGWPSFAVTGPVALGLSLAAVIGVVRLVAPKAAARVREAYLPIRATLANARMALDQYSEQFQHRLQEKQAESVRKREAEESRAKKKFDAELAEARKTAESAMKKADEAHTWLQREIEERYATNRQQADREWKPLIERLEQRLVRSTTAVRGRYEREMGACQAAYDRARADLEVRCRRGLDHIRAFLDRTAGLDPRALMDWSDPAWEQWRPTSRFSPVIRFGQIEIEMKRLSDDVLKLGDFAADHPANLRVPAVLTLPHHASLLVQTDQQGRDEAIAVLQAVMARLLTSLPPGRVRFTIIDPVGLGRNFAGFMHLADYQEALVDSRIWTEAAHVEQRLNDLTNHMENVIQKYLRNEFESIDAYNRQAGELAEPYRFLVVADFPAGFNEEAARRLSSIVSSGARCGVYTLIAHDIRQQPPIGVQVDDISARSITLVRESGRFVWQDEVCRQFPLTVDAPPAEATLTRLMHAVGNLARDANRVEVPFDTIAPPPDRIWSSSAAEELRIPVGRTGAVRIQELRLGRGVAQHALIAGKTGSGKSTLLHVMITNLALWYSPDEVELYLIDFKKGVEFKTYVTNDLPHARAVAIESDREFGLSVLRRIDAEMNRRGDLLRRAGVQDLPAYRQATGEKMPRTLLMVDEFQVFFSEDDKLAQDAAILLDRLVRQGRAFGIHVILGSQTLGGTSGLARSTIGQMAVRIALQCSDADSRLILDDENAAARLLSRPGEAIYNDAGGLMTGNSPFQTAWLADDRRDELLERVSRKAEETTVEREPLIVFEGNAPSDIAGNRLLSRLLAAPNWPVTSAAPQAWLGDAVAIKDPTSVAFRRQSGSNLLMVGQRDEAALAMMASAMVSLAAQQPPRSARFIILDGSPADAPWAGYLQRVASILPHATRIVEYRELGEAMNELSIELQRRQQGEVTAADASIYLIIYGLQRYRPLRRQEDEFSFARTDEDAPPDPGRQLSELLREGPHNGIHTLAWADTPVTLDRTFNRQSMREFDNRVLFQMSAADSSNLIDSPAANRLGLYRALLHSEELGLFEQFRPYAMLQSSWLEYVENRFRLMSSAAGHEIV